MPLHSPSFTERCPEGDERLRRVCDHCGFVDYVNPRLVVGAVCSWEDRVLLCERGIEPRVGFWTIPSGFLERHETTMEGAARETREEAGAEIAIDALLAIYEVPRIAHVHLIYRARLRGPELVPGPESRSARLFAWDEIPWPDLAFPSVVQSLRRFHAVRDVTGFAPALQAAREEEDWKALRR